MIIKSLSRKSPSFGQLAAYMSSEKSDARFDLYRHCYKRNPDDIAAEFFENSRHLTKRKNGNFLYHEIISLSVEEGADPEVYKVGLQNIVDTYVEARCPDNLVYGCLHQDHGHNLHYHLMISANARGDAKRTRLTRAQFDVIKRKLEEHVLRDYPELKQKELIGANRDGEKMSRKAGEVQRRLGALPKREEAKETLLAAMNQTSSMGNFHFYLEERGYQFYMRGKNYGVEVVHEDGTTKKYRFSTLGVHDQFEAFSELVTRSECMDQAEDRAGEKEKTDPDQVVEPEQEPLAHAVDDALKREPEPYTEGQDEQPQQAEKSARVKKKKSQSERRKKRAKDGQADGRSQKADKEAYVNYDSKADLKSNTASQQNPQAEATTRNKKPRAKDEDEMKLKDIMGVRDTLKDKRKANAATKDDVTRASDAAGRKAEARVKQEMDKTAEATAKRTADQVRQEFERMTAKQKESAKHMPKQKR